MSSKGAGALRTRPWARPEPGGMYVGHDGSVWLYRELSLAPVQHEDAPRRMELGAEMEQILEEVGSRSRDVGQGMAMLSQNRSVHIFSVTFEVLNNSPQGTPEALDDLLHEMLPAVTRSKTLLLGVKLRSSVLAQAAKAKGGVGAKVKAALAPTADANFSLDPYAADYRDIDAIFRRNGATEPRPEALRQLEAWWNHGETPDSVNQYANESFLVPGGAEYQICAVQSMPQTLMAPFSQWLLDAMTHSSPVKAVSIRADLEPHTVTRSRLRRQRRRLIAQEQEEQATGDLGREENSSALQMAQDVESYVVSSRTPWLANASILLAHEVDNADETYRDMLANVYRIVTQPVVARQLEALDEMQPASAERINPFPQHLNLAMVSHAGLRGFSRLGDPHGVWTGNIDPDYVPFYTDPFGASRNDRPPVMCIFGDPGSGKTFTAQLIAGECAIAGVSAFFVNPKPFDSLRPWAAWVASRGVRVRVVTLTEMEERSGMFDPFTFCADRQIAAEILGRHIMTVFAGAFTRIQEFALIEGLADGARAGARCASEAMAYVKDPEIVNLVATLARSNSLFRLAFATEPHDEWADTTGLTLIEFDRELPMPVAGKPPAELSESLALATLRLTSRAAMEILMRAGGGVYVVDEAHHYLASAEGAAALERLGREGRSMGLLPIFITQRPSDLLQMDMESFMSRVLCMKLDDAQQARAALELCRLEPTASRITFLRTAGPRRAVPGVPGRPAMGYLRDLYNRHAVVSIGPVPEHLRLAMSTNRTDRELREAQANVADGPDSKEVQR